MLRPVCVKDQREYKVKKCGIALLEMADRGGTRVPYCVYFADLWECPVCGHEIIGGYGFPVAREHEKERMQKILDVYEDLDRLYVTD